MLDIYIPLAGNPKIKYSLHCLFTVFLGIDINIIEDENTSDIDIRIGVRTLIIKKSAFWEKQSIPKSVTKQKLTFDSKEFDIVSLFGPITISQEGDIITLEFDIIASTFFMLTRWEEHASDKKDTHGRFSAKESVAFKHDFLERPIVNEYVELLGAILTKMGCKQKKKKRTFTLVPTHDVDKPFLIDGWMRNARYIVGSLKRARFFELARYTKHLIKSSDPFDTYDRMMNLSERENAKSHFFFLQKGTTRADENHEIDTPKIKKLIQHIQARGHLIGYHPSYNAYNDESLFRKEKQNLARVSDQEINSGRHHFLRWDVNATPQIWQENNMAWDSTLGYADHAGFRCGVCYPFPLYDLVNNRQLDVYERPLVAMEWSLIHYQGLSIDQVEAKIVVLKNQVKKYNGEFVFLYHNSAFYTNEYHGVSDRLLNSFYN
ncbi:MAG: hypothetical protein ACJATI_002020 [Halioglobus sp.]